MICRVYSQIVAHVDACHLNILMVTKISSLTRCRFYFVTNYQRFSSAFQLAQRKIRDILTQVKQPQKGGMGMGPSPHSQSFTDMGSPPQGLAQEHQQRRK